MAAGSADPRPLTRVKGGEEWLGGGASDLAWIEDATELGPGITCGVPPGFASYCTLIRRMFGRGLVVGQRSADESAGGR